MWPHKPNKSREAAPFPGDRRALDGLAAVFAMETMAGGALAVQTDPALAEVSGSLGLPEPNALAVGGDNRHFTELARLPGLLAGLAVGGLRAGALVTELGAIRGDLPALAGKRLSCVINLCARASRRQAGALYGGHDDYYAASDAGLFQMFASNAQEAADFTLIAHRVAELSLVPGLCAQDYYATAHSVQTLSLPERALADAFLGAPEDLIKAPTPAQEVLFGKNRRRIPRWIDGDRPAGLGGFQDADSFHRSLAAQRPFFADHLDGILTEAMDEYGRLSGRRYQPVAAYRGEDAEVLIVAMGAVVEKLAAVVDYLREAERVKAGLLNLSVLRPFPGARLAQLLKGKRAVAVLERNDTPLAEDAPLMRELRGAIDKATEGGGKGAAARSGAPGYTKRSDRPRLYSGIYGVGAELPSFEQLCAVFKNMLPGGERRRRFYLGVDFDQRPRVPQLQILQHQLSQAYPTLKELSLPAHSLARQPRTNRAMELHSLALQGGLFAGKLFARALHAALETDVRTYPQGGLEPTLQRSRLTLAYGEADCRSRPPAVATVLLAGDSLLDRLIPAGLLDGATMVVATGTSGEALWQSLPRHAEALIRDRQVRLFTLDARAIAGAQAAHPGFIDQLEIWALLGASLHADGALKSAAGKIGALLSELLESLLKPGDPLIAAIGACFNLGTERAAEVDWRRLPPPERPPLAEREAPWTVPRLDATKEPLFDRTRFWHSVGYLHDRGRADQTLVDPFLATGVLPAGSSAHRDMSPYRRRLPQWLPENCTGCGACWSLCPDSALPPTVQHLESIVATALRDCREQGRPMTQLARITGHLVKQAQALVRADGLSRYRTAGLLLGDAFARLLARMAPDEHTASALQEDLKSLCERLADWPLARTEAFFDAPEQATKGTGALLSISLNTASCKACGICVESCPEGALVWAERQAESIVSERRNWDFRRKLPEVEQQRIEQHVRQGEPESQVNRLLADGVYHSMVGGDGAFPGNGLKVAVHLLSAAIESVMRIRFKAHADRLGKLISQLKEKIQGEVAGAVKINDFDEFAAHLSRLDDAEPDAEVLVRLLDREKTPAQVEPRRLLRLSRLLAALEAQRRRYGPDGADRGRLLLAIDGAQVLLWSGTYPDNPHANPWISHAGGDAVSLARGLFAALAPRLAMELADCRLAELELKDRCRKDEHQRLREQLSWDQLEPDERALLPPLLVIGQREVTPWSEVAGALAGSGPICVAILDSAGVEVSAGHGDSHAGLGLARGDAFVLQSSIGNPGHLIAGVVQSLESARPALFQIFATDPQTSGCPPEKVAELARLAYASRGAPLFVFDPRPGGGLSLAENPEPQAPWANQDLSIKEPSGDRTLRVPLTVADWAIRQARFRKHFRIISKGRISEQMKPLAEFVALDGPARENITPYIHVTDPQQRLFIATVSPAMTAATERCLRNWERLADMAREKLPETDPRTAEPAPSPAATRPAPGVAEVNRELTNKLLQMCGFADDPEFFQQPLRDFLEKKAAAAETSPDERQP